MRVSEFLIHGPSIIWAIDRYRSGTTRLLSSGPRGPKMCKAVPGTVPNCNTVEDHLKSLVDDNRKKRP